MPNLAQSLKSEIQRISRKEIKTTITPLHSSTVQLKKTIADLKRKVAALEADNKRLSSLQKKIQPVEPEVSPEIAEKVRIMAKSIKKLRDRLGLSQTDFGKLIGVSSQNVFVMEHKEGRLKPRGNTLANIMAVKGIGKREAKKRLEEMHSS